MLSIRGQLSHYHNPQADASSHYPEALKSIFSLEQSRIAKAFIEQWPGYEPTPLYALPELAKEILVEKAENIATVNYMLEAGSAHAGRSYFLLGSFSGTSPGLPLTGGHVTLPLNWDLFSEIIFANANRPVFTNFFGVLDAGGKAIAQLNIPLPLDPSTVGFTIYFAFFLDKPFKFVSNPLECIIVP